MPLPDYDEIAKSISSSLYETLSQHASEQNVLLGSLQDRSIEAYLTENADLLSISFELKYSITTLEGLDGVCVVKGSASYNLSSKLASSPELGRIEYLDAQGNRITGNVFLYATCVSGTRSVPYEVRRRLGDQKR
jgi:hypothetical protein